MFTKIRNFLSLSKKNDYPNFMIIGAQKAGTTALYEYLSRHPQIQATREKELHYFNCETRYKHGIKFYRSFFKLNENLKLTFDASPGYLNSTSAPKRIYTHNPNVKIIILLRDPVERAYSAWNMYKKRYMDNRSWFFDQWISYCGNGGITFFRRTDDRLYDFMLYAKDEIEFNSVNKSSDMLEAPILSHGFYYDQIQKYLSLFNKKQILILENSEMRTNTIKCLKKIEAFLDISCCDWESESLTPVFEGEYSAQVDLSATRYLRDYYRSSNERLFNYLGKRYDWDVE